MANTGLVTIDVTKTIDITSNNDVNIQSTYGNIEVAAVNGGANVYSNGAMTIESNTSISISAPLVSINGDSLILTGQTESVGNTLTVIEQRVSVLEANVYTPGNTGNSLTTRAYVSSVATALANSTAAVASDVSTLEATLYNPDTGLASTRALATSTEIALASNVLTLSSRIDSVQASANVANRTYVQSSAPAAPAISPVEGDLWFNTANNYVMNRYDGNGWIAIPDGRISGSLAAVTSEQNARIANDEVMAQNIDIVFAVANDALAAVQIETAARIANGNSTASLIQTLQSQVANNTSRITLEETTRANADEALATQIESIVTATGLSGSKTFLQSSTPTNMRAGDLWFKTNENYRMYRYSGSSWEPVDDTRIASVVAGLTSEQQARSTADSAQTQRIDSAFSRIANSEAWISTVQTTLTNNVESLASQVETLQVTAGENTGAVTFVQTAAPTGAKVGDLWFDNDDSYKMYRLTYDLAGNTWIEVSDRRANLALSSISTEQTARIANDAAMTTRIDSAFSRISNSEAWISSVETSLAGNNAATASALNTLSTRVYSNATYYQATAPGNPANGWLWFDTSTNNIARRWNGSGWVVVADTRIAASEANILSLSNTVSNLSTSVATLTSNVNARLNENDAEINSLQQAFANDSQATATSIQRLQANVNGLSSGVTLALSAAANAQAGVNGLQSSAQLVVNAGRIAGFKATSTAATSEFVIQADKFKIESLTGSGTTIPFSVVDGVTYINNAVIRNGSIDTGKVAPGAISDSRYVSSNIDVLFEPNTSSTATDPLSMTFNIDVDNTAVLFNSSVSIRTLTDSQYLDPPSITSSIYLYRNGSLYPKFGSTADSSYPEQILFRPGTSISNQWKSTLNTVGVTVLQPGTYTAYVRVSYNGAFSGGNPLPKFTVYEPFLMITGLKR